MKYAQLLSRVAKALAQDVGNGVMSLSDAVSALVGMADALDIFVTRYDAQNYVRSYMMYDSTEKE